MSKSPEPESILIENDQSIRTLSRAIIYSQGEFSLILVRCNYASLRESMMLELRQHCAVEIQELELSPDSKTLYTAIANEIGESHPSVLVVFGLETVHDVDTVLASTNQVREEFRKAYAFPLVLWINDTILRKLIKQVPDLESWASIIEFEMPSNGLKAFLQTSVDEIFEDLLDVGAAPFLSKCSRELRENSRLHSEITLAQQDIQHQEIQLNPDLIASLEFLNGLAAASLTDVSRHHYEQSLILWPSGVHPERLGCVLYQLGLWWRTFAVRRRSEFETYCLRAIEYFQRAITTFESANRPDLVAKFINPLGEVLQRLEKWDNLEPLALKSLVLNETYANLYRQAEASGCLAEALLGCSAWSKAKQRAEQALQHLEMAAETDPEPYLEERQDYIRWQNSFCRGWYLFTLGKAQWHLDQRQDAICTLEAARQKTRPEYDPLLFIQILRTLRHYYFEQKDYLKAFKIRLEYRSIEQQYEFRAFVGAGRLQPNRESMNPALVSIASTQKAHVSREIEASGRQEDVSRLIERISRADQKLTVLHGQSGVGKSSIIQAGLIPSLTPITLDTRQVITILQQIYTNWTKRLGEEILEALQNFGIISLPKAIDSPPVILEHLRKSVDRNLMVVLIFDQFEEFFFVHKEPIERKSFYEFLRECLNIPYIKVILSLREDYLHYLLECNERLVNLDAIGNNILDKNILFYLGNFSRHDAQSIISSLTKNTPYPLDIKLTEALVEELSEDLGEVRPIELQVVGAQLQTEQITTLEEYRDKGPKDALVSRYLDEVTRDCGPENEDIARLVLYLLTDENNTRPIKTREDIELEINVLGKLDLILAILVQSGLVFRIPSSPSDRYQLVHDYLVIFVRQTQSTQLIAELEREREQRQLTEDQLNKALTKQLRTARRAAFMLAGLVTAIASVAVLAVLAFINTSISSQINASAKDEELARVVSALRAGKLRQGLPGVIPEIHTKTLSELNQAISSARIVNNMRGHTDEITDITLSKNNQLIASSSRDKTTIIWGVDGSKISLLEHPDVVNCVEFSPNGSQVITGSDDGFIRLWDTKGILVKVFEVKHSDGVSSLSFSPNGETIISGGSDGAIKIWDKSGNFLESLERHNSKVLGIYFSNDSKRFATYANFDPVKVSRIDEPNEEYLFSTFNTIGLRFQPQTNAIEIAERTGEIYIYDFPDRLIGAKSIPIYSTPPDTRLLSFSKNKDLLSFVEGWRKNVISINVSSNIFNRVSRIELPHKDELVSFDIGDRNNIVVSADKSNSITIWDISEEIHNLENALEEIRDFSRATDNTGTYTRASQIDSLYKIIRLDPTMKFSVLGERYGTTALVKNIQGESPNTSSISNTVLTFDTSGKYYITSQNSYSIKVWNFENSTISVNEPFNSNIYFKSESLDFNSFSQIASSSDGGLIASGNKDGSLSLWNSNGTLVFSVQAHSQKIDMVVLSPDKEKIVSASRNEIKLWNIRGELLDEIILDNDQDSWRQIVFKSNSQSFLALTQSGLVKLYLFSEEKIVDLYEHHAQVNSIGFSPDGETILTATSSTSLMPYGDKAHLKLWNPDGTLRYEDKNFGNGLYVDFSFDGEEIYSYGYFSSSVDRIGSDGSSLNSLRGHAGIITGVFYSPDGNFIATSSEDSTIRLWQRNGDPISILRGHNAPIVSLSISQESQKIVSVDIDGVVNFWDRNQENPVLTIKKYAESGADNYSNYIQFSMNGENVVLQIANRIIVLDRLGREVLDSEFSYFINLNSSRINSNFENLISVNHNPKLSLWDIDGNLISYLDGHKIYVNSVVFSPDGQHIASASDDNKVIIWNAKGEMVKVIEHDEDVNSITFSPDGNYLATASDDNFIRVFDADGNPLLDDQGNSLRLSGHTDSVTSVLFSPLSDILASASSDNTIRLWDTKTWKQDGKEFEIPESGPETYGALNRSDVLWFSEDGNILAYGTSPVYVRLLNRRFRGGTWIKEAFFYPVRDIPVEGLPDDKHWLTVRGNKGTIILSLGLEYSMKEACAWAANHLRFNDNESDDRLCDELITDN